MREIEYLGREANDAVEATVRGGKLKRLALSVSAVGVSVLAALGMSQERLSSNEALVAGSVGVGAIGAVEGLNRRSTAKQVGAIVGDHAGRLGLSEVVFATARRPVGQSVYRWGSDGKLYEERTDRHGSVVHAETKPHEAIMPKERNIYGSTNAPFFAGAAFLNEVASAADGKVSAAPLLGIVAGVAFMRAERADRDLCNGAAKRIEALGQMAREQIPGSELQG